jgi:periplasmic glucans biosynthesis protein
MGMKSRKVGQIPSKVGHTKSLIAMMTRRELLSRIIGLAAWGTMNPTLLSAWGRNKISAVGLPFNKEWLRTEAKRIAMKPYVAPSETLPAWLADLDWDGYQSIRFKPERSLWINEQLPFQVRLFHMGLLLHKAITIHEVIDGFAHQIEFTPDLFNYGAKVKVPSHSSDLGFAGFRVHTKENFELDMFAFLGASYFRAVGGTKQYGLSARGLAIDTGMERPEEFPDFKSFWLERPAADSDTVTIHSLLDSPSMAGAYTFKVNPGETTIMDVESYLFPRKSVERIGIAPLTSMFQHGENDKRVADDFRPEIHDSDGLAMWTGKDEWIWRPLVNSPVTRVNSFLDENPKGFGLLQRDRNFDHYQDDGAYYDKRPSLWVEPLGNWGNGAVMLVELPAADETFDNIVAFWNPSESVKRGNELHLHYKLHWGSQQPVRPNNAEVIATRIGASTSWATPLPGQWAPGQKKLSSRKFVIDFLGGRLKDFPYSAKVEPVITISRGKLIEPAVRPIKGGQPGCWRCSFDLLAEGREPVDLRCYLKDADGALTETWLYQWTPG